MHARSSALPVALLAASLALSSASLVHAQSGADRAAAEALFQDGLKLMEQGKHDLACPKLQESQRLDPALGTLLYLAECQERMGLFASAWTNFLEAQGLAKTAGQAEREKAAKRRAILLQPKIHKLAVDAAQPLPEGAVVRRNDTVLGPVSLGTLLPVDPGAYLVEVSAPGYVTYKKNLQIPNGPGETRVAIPTLAREAVKPSTAASVSPDASAAAPAPSPSTTATSPLPPLDKMSPAAEGSLVPVYVAGGVGAIGLVVGGIFGARAFGQWDSSNQHCPSGACDQEGVDAAQRAKTAATVSTIGFVVGAVGVGAGVTLWATRKKPGGASSDVALLARPAGVSLQGAF